VAGPHDDGRTALRPQVTLSATHRGRIRQGSVVDSPHIADESAEVRLNAPVNPSTKALWTNPPMP